MAETEQMLKTVLFMQAEILGRLEALEQSLDSTGSSAEDLMRRSVGLAYAPVYEDPRKEALHQMREALGAGSDAELDAAINEVVRLTNR